MRNKFHTILMVAIFTQCYSSLYAMDESIKKQIKHARQQAAKYRVAHLPCPLCEKGDWGCETDVWIGHSFNQQVEGIVHNAGDLMSNEEKLNHLFGDPRFSQRKEIIKKMIEKDKIHPNAIIYQCVKTPLNESALYKDHDFARYLLEHGATFDKKTIEERPKFVVQVCCNRKDQLLLCDK